MHVRPVLKKNALRALFYVIITWTVTHALGIPLTYCIGMLFIPFGAWVAIDYAERTVMLRKWHPEIWMSCFFFVLGVIPYLREDWAEKYIIVGNNFVVSGILFLLADQLWGFGLERMARVTSNRLKWAWTIWRYVGVIVRVLSIHMAYDRSQHEIIEFRGCSIVIDEERMIFQTCGFFVLFVFRLMQLFLTYAMVDPGERERGGPLGRKQR